MQTALFVLALTILLVIYGLLNAYPIRRLCRALGPNSPWRKPARWTLSLLASAYPLGRLLERFAFNGFAETLVMVGSFYMGVFFYGLLLTLMADLLRLILRLSPPGRRLLEALGRKSALLAACSLGSIVLLCLVAHINALSPRVRTLDLTIDKPLAGHSTLNVVLASDLHLGTVIRNHRLEQTVETINRLHPDIILFPGDIVDEDVTPLARQNMADTLKRLRAPLGVWAVTGNHEYFGGVERTVAYVERGGIRFLHDRCISPADGLILAGRRDRRAESTPSGRLSVETLLAGVDRHRPILLMDHQPHARDLEYARKAGVDLLLSGHTHNGQLWPLNYLTEAIYPISWGLGRFGDTQVYVSCGLGTWGPPMRLGSVPEIVQLKLHFRPTSPTPGT